MPVIDSDNRRPLRLTTRVVTVFGILTIVASAVALVVSVWPQYLPRFEYVLGPVTLIGMMAIYSACWLLFRRYRLKLASRRRSSPMLWSLLIAGLAVLAVSFVFRIAAPEPTGFRVPKGADSITIQLEGREPVTVYRIAGDPHEVARYRAAALTWIGLGLIVVANVVARPYVPRSESGTNTIPATG